ncbi:ead/Ea22-like family protein [Pseudomonas prosekii]|uniref:Uncharacterized protein n=1 Tax=Pseudomonas prosekii TaxID=1148509 RepID=A0A1H2B220_9PSED|nr:ead/Ea22-like family protein [Pseudomonas prosekii]SDT52330.1 hypothetical protein SAMN05216222_4872 [Pseudomonas prosekii]
MSDYSKLKALAEAATPGKWDYEQDCLFFYVDGYTKHLMELCEGGDVDGIQQIENAKFIAAANPAAVLALIAESEEYKAVAEQPASLNAVPATEYAVLKRQFFALRNYALCKDKLSGYYSRELEKMRGVDRSQSAVEIDAERDINEQLTNDLLSVETERDDLKAEIAGLKTGYEAYEAQNAVLRGEVEALRKDAERYRWIRVKQTFIWLIQDWFPKENSLTDVDAEIDTAMGKGERS